MELAALISDCRDVLDAKYKAREMALVHGRALTRTCANAIRALHRGEWEAARSALDTARNETASVANSLAAHPDLLFAGYVQDAHKELAEAEILLAFFAKRPAPHARRPANRSARVFERTGRSRLRRTPRRP